MVCAIKKKKTGKKTKTHWRCCFRQIDAFLGRQSPSQEVIFEKRKCDYQGKDHLSEGEQKMQRPYLM